MNLSHLDISKTFTLHDAACAAVGIDPEVWHLATQKDKGRAARFLREMNDAAFCAEQYARTTADALECDAWIDQCGTLMLDIWCALVDDEDGHMLMSVQLERLVSERNRTGGKVNLLELPEDRSEFLFARDELARWFAARGFDPAYQFIKQANQASLATMVEPTKPASNVTTHAKGVAAIGTFAIHGATMAKLTQAVAAFPEKYPEYQSKPPKKDGDMDVWLEATFKCSKRESFVFASILREHFCISS